MLALLRVEDLKKSFVVKEGLLKKRRIEVLKGVSFEVNPKEIFGISGPTGSGKSTLAKIIAGLLQYDSGKIMWNKDLVREPKREIKYIPQNPLASLNPRLKVREVLTEPLRVWHRDKKDSWQDLMLSALKKVKLSERVLDSYPNQLSGGERQRVCIALALECEPRVLICDEIISFLDLTLQIQIINLLLNLRDEMGLTIILISHNTQVLKSVCERILKI